MLEHRRTVNIHCGKKLSGKSRDEILTAILGEFQNVVAVQQNHDVDVIGVTFKEEEHALSLPCERRVCGFSICGAGLTGVLPSLSFIFLITGMKTLLRIFLPFLRTLAL